MLVDFCHWSMKTVVTSSCVSSEGHDVENLVSKDFVLKKQGFLAERFLKPPVSVTFAFPCSINVHQVIINPVVGQQKSSVIEVFTNSQKLTSSWLLGLDGVSQKQIPTQLTPLSVGRIEMKDPAMVCFFNPSFHATSPYSVDDSDFSRFPYVVEMKHSYGTALVSHLTIRITKTFESLIPGIKSVAVLGQPSHKYDRHILEKVFYHYINALNFKQTSTVTENSNRSMKDCSATQDIPDFTSEFEVPEEFMDPITCEVMALPTLLPCGKSIDHHTLEKYLENEATYGRLPNDPFTGVTFNSEMYPVPNNSLKVRIDQFLMKHGDEDQVRSAPRTVGRKEGQYSFTNIKFNSAAKTHETSINLSSNVSTVKRKKKSLSVSEQQVKIAKVHQCCENVSTINSQNRLSLHGRHGNSGEVSSMEHRIPSHERRLNSSLDDAMSILQQLPSFTRMMPSVDDSMSFTRMTPIVDDSTSFVRKASSVDDSTSFARMTHSDVTSRALCVSCGSLVSSLTATYRLACGHSMCRTCLTSRPPGRDVNSAVTCGQCKSVCQRSDVCRIFQ